MKMMNIKMKDKNNLAIRLFLEGKYLQKEIALIVKVSEKTVSTWIRNSPQVLAAKAKNEILNRIKKEGATISPDDLSRLTDAAIKLHKIASPL